MDTKKIDLIWIHTASDLGFKVVRSDDCYASTDGRGVIQIGSPDTLDRDDSLAQLVFHELCHALVQGPDNLSRPDWGLDNTNDDDIERERACLRIQALLAGRHGLRDLMIPTTVVRADYQALPIDPMHGSEDAAVIARAAVARPLFDRWAVRLDRTLAATAQALVDTPDGVGGDRRDEGSM